MKLDFNNPNTLGKFAVGTGIVNGTENRSIVRDGVYARGHKKSGYIITGPSRPTKSHAGNSPKRIWQHGIELRDALGNIFELPNYYASPFAAIREIISESFNLPGATTATLVMRVKGNNNPVRDFSLGYFPPTEGAQFIGVVPANIVSTVTIQATSDFQSLYSMYGGCDEWTFGGTEPIEFVYAIAIGVSRG
jgi:hypothetical protein